MLSDFLCNWFGTDLKIDMCRVRGDVKRKLGDLQGALADLNSAYDLEPDNYFTLRCTTKLCIGMT